MSHLESQDFLTAMPKLYHGCILMVIIKCKGQATGQFSWFMSDKYFSYFFTKKYVDGTSNKLPQHMFS